MNKTPNSEYQQAVEKQLLALAVAVLKLVPDVDGNVNLTPAVAQAMTAITAVIERLIGDDEQTMDDPKNHNHFRNSLRASQRKALGK